MPDNRTAIICGTILIAIILGGIFALAWHGTLTGAEASIIVTSIITGIIGVFGAHAGVKSGAKAAAAGVTATKATEVK